MSRKLKKLKTNSKKGKPLSLAAEFSSALSLHQQGQFDQAELIYKKILKSNPRHTDSLNLLANIYQQKSNFSRAENLLLKAIKQQPNRPDLHSNLGSAYRGLQKTSEAIKSYQKALQCAPDHFESQYNLSWAFYENGDLDLAVDALRKTIHLKPRLTEAHEQLVNFLEMQGKINEALAALDKIISFDEDNPTLYRKKGDILQNLDRFDDAILAYKKAITIDPENAVAHNNLGNVLIKSDKLHESIKFYQNAIALNPDMEEAYVNLSWVYKEHGLISKDIACMQEYLTNHPNSPRAHSDLLFSMNYDPSLTPQHLFHEAQRWWELHKKTKLPFFNHQGPKDITSPLKTIGFLSPDFRKHPVGTFLVPLLENLKGKIKVICFAEMHDNQHDSITDKIKNLTVWFPTLGLTSEDAANLIHRQNVDILIDLAGHSANNRLDIMTLKPAPIQISWLGYVNTTGLDNIDYRITDLIADPIGAEQFYSEKLIRMPDSFFCYYPIAASPEISALPAETSGHVTFASFNNIAKINEKVIELWAQILCRVKDSKIIMIGSPFRDKNIKDRYYKLFADHGVEEQRIELLPSLPMRKYLEMHNQVDIALDPFPHNGHTITCHTLWMGVPVIVLRGERYAARMGASVLTGAGLSELIAESQADYVNKAVDLAENLKKLSDIRLGLREKVKQAKFSDSAKFAKDFLELLKKTWSTWQETN